MSKRLALVLSVLAVVLFAAGSLQSAPAPSGQGKQNFKGVTLNGVCAGGIWTAGMEKIFGGALEAKTGARVKLGSNSTQGMVAQAIAERDNPQIDFITVDDAVLPELMANKAAVKADFTKIPNAKGFFAPVQAVVNRFQGHLVPFFIQENGIGYRADLLRQKNLPEPKTWADLWNPAYKGKVMLTAFNYTFSWAAMEAIAAVRTGDPKNILGAFEELKKLKESGQVGLVVDTLPALEKAFTEGEAWVGLTSNGRIWGLQDKGVDVQFVNPSDYPLAQSGGVVATRKSANWDALMAYFNETVDPRNQAKFLQLAPYGPTLRQTREYLDAKSLVRFRTTDSQVEAIHVPNWDHMRQFRPALTDRFVQEIAR